MKKSLVFSLLLLFMLAPLASIAEVVTGHKWLGASVLITNYDQLDDDVTGFKLFGGLQLTPLLGVEVTYTDLGESSNGALSNSISGLNVALAVSVNISTQVFLTGRIGMFVWDADSNTGLSDSGNDISLGGSLGFSISDTLYLRGDVDRFEANGISDETVMSYGIGVMQLF